MNIKQLNVNSYIYIYFLYIYIYFLIFIIGPDYVSWGSANMSTLAGGVGEDDEDSI
jgi:hypothetical protein